MQQGKGTKEVLFDGVQEHDLYKLSMDVSKRSHAFLGERVSNNVLWHFRLGHLPKKAIGSLVNKNLLKSSCKEFSSCKSCLFGKSSALPHKSRNTTYENPLSLVFCRHLGACTLCFLRWISLFYQFRGCKEQF